MRIATYALLTPFIYGQPDIKEATVSSSLVFMIVYEAFIPRRDCLFVVHDPFFHFRIPCVAATLVNGGSRGTMGKLTYGMRLWSTPFWCIH